MLQGIDAARKPATQAAAGAAAAAAAATEASAAGAVAGNEEGVGEEDGTSPEGVVKAGDPEARGKGKAAEREREGKRARLGEQEDESDPKGEVKGEGSSSSRLAVLQRAVQRALASGQPLVLHCLGGSLRGGGVEKRDGGSQPVGVGGKSEGEEGRSLGGAEGPAGTAPAVPGEERVEAAAALPTHAPGAEQRAPAPTAATQAPAAPSPSPSPSAAAAAAEAVAGGRAVACGAAGQDEGTRRIDAAALHRMDLQSLPVRVIQTGATVALPKPVRTAGSPAGASGCAATAAASTAVGQQKAGRPGVDGKVRRIWWGSASCVPLDPFQD